MVWWCGVGSLSIDLLSGPDSLSEGSIDRWRERETDRERERERGRQTDRQRQRQTDRQSQRQRERRGVGFLSIDLLSGSDI